MRINFPLAGFLIGLAAPFAGLAVMYVIWGSGQRFAEFFMELFVLKDLGSKVFTLSLLANLLPFIFFNSKRYDLAARGVFVATMIYVVFIILLKFVW